MERTVQDLIRNQEPKLQTEGSFKSVDVYDFFVVKTSLYPEDYEEEERTDEWYMSGEPGPSDCEEEMATEYCYIMSKKHLPIFPPIIAGNEFNFAMKRVKTFKEIMGKKHVRYQANRLEAIYIHRVVCGLMYRIKRVGGNPRYGDYINEFTTFVKMGLKSGLSVPQMINNLYWFITENATSGLMQDMHSANIGVRGRKIVTFDTGQVNRSSGSVRSNSRKVRALIDKWRSK